MASNVAATPAKTARFSFRGYESDRELFEDAAAAAGMTLSDYFIDRLRACARAEFEIPTEVSLSQEAFEQVMDIFQSPASEKTRCFIEENRFAS